MRNHYGIYFDADRCVQCHACEIACKCLNGIEPGVKWRGVYDAWKGSFPKVSNRSMSLACLHCAYPACESACPTGAIHKRGMDGIVTIEASKCIGCRSCLLACPFGSPQFGRDGKMQKCHLCLDRVQAGKEPACVATCPAEALSFGTMETLNELAARKAAQKMAAASLPHGEDNDQDCRPC